MRMLTVKILVVAASVVGACFAATAAPQLEVLSASARPLAHGVAIYVEVRSREAASHVAIDIELRDASGKRIGRRTFDAARSVFASGESREFRGRFDLSPLQSGGPLRVAVGASTADHSVRTHWNGFIASLAAAQATPVVPRPRPRTLLAPVGGKALPVKTATASPPSASTPLAVSLVSAQVSPSFVNPGQTVHIAASVSANAAASGLLVNLELHDPVGVKVGQWTVNGQSFVAGVARSYAWDFVVPTDAVPKSYSLTVGVVTPGFVTRYLWTDTPKRFAIVGAGVCLTPTPTRFDTESVSKTYGFSLHGPASNADYDLIASTGAGVVRTNLYWPDVETQKGVYDFSASDAIVAALEARNITPLFILGYGNGLYTSDNPAPPAAAWRAAFAAYARAAAAHFRGRGVIWEIWNEPNGATFWSPPDADDYAALVLATSNAIRSADPNAAILAGVTSGVDWTFVQAIARAGVLPVIDAISVHPYRHTEPETVATDLATLRAVMESAATPCSRQLPIVSSEWGYSTTWNTGARAAYSAEQQAYFLMRQWLMASYLGLPVSIYYDFKNDGADPDDAEDNFGVVNADSTPKPAFNAARDLAGQLQGFSFSHRIPTGSAKQWSLLFESGSEIAIVNWTDDASVIADQANIPSVFILGPQSDGYAANRHAAELIYPRAQLMAATGSDVLAEFVIRNDEATAANVVLQVGEAISSVALTPGQHYTVYVDLSLGTSMNLQGQTFPVSMTWNGAVVPNLPAVQVANYRAIAAMSGFPATANCGVQTCYATGN